MDFLKKVQRPEMTAMARSIDSKVVGPIFIEKSIKFKESGNKSVFTTRPLLTVCDAMYGRVYIDGAFRHAFCADPCASLSAPFETGLGGPIHGAFAKTYNTSRLLVRTE